MSSSDPQQRWPRLPHWIHKPRQANPDSQSSSHSLQPQGPPPTPEGPIQTHIPVQSMCREGQGGRAHAVVTEAEAPRTDLETPVVWLLMEIREEMVMRGRGGLETLEAQHSALGHGPSTLP